MKKKHDNKEQSQISQVWIPFQVFSREFCEVFQKSYSKEHQ